MAEGRSSSGNGGAPTNGTGGADEDSGADESTKVPASSANIGSTASESSTPTGHATEGQPFLGTGYPQPSQYRFPPEPDLAAEENGADLEPGTPTDHDLSNTPWAGAIAYHPDPNEHDDAYYAPPAPTWRQRRLMGIAVDKEYARNLEIINKCLGAVVVLAITVFVIWQLRPDLIFGPNTDVGGDNGGHVAAPYYMIHHLLNHGQISGWDPWWFDGFPLYVFYFPLPALLVAALNLVFPYAVAFKIVTVLGTLTLPLCAWAFGQLAGFRRPTPVLMAAAMLPYLFNTSYTIDGGNITSTMAGEFSFSLALSFGMLFLGVFAYGLRTGRLRWLAAVLFAATVLCHVVPALVVAGAAVLMAIAMTRTSALKVLVPVGLVGGLLVAFWLVPFGADLQYTSSMNYQPVTGLHANLDPYGWIWVLIPAAAGLVLAILQAAHGRHNMFPLVLGVAAIGSGAAFEYIPSGLVYNGRWLPFWFLFTLLLAAYALGEAFRGIGVWLVSPIPEWSGAMAGSLLCVAAAAWAGGLIGAFPGIAPSNANTTQVQGWVDWNYTGFQGKSGWPEYQGMINMLDAAGKKYGCGRLQYEYISETTDPFGSTEAMMALPMQTSGCMATTDGIYFESSTTTPFHFLNVSEVSQNGESPDPISGLNYPGFDLPDGVRHLQFMGDRYFLAMSPPVEAAAAADPSLVKIASTKGFPLSNNTLNGNPDPHPVYNLYLIKASPLVTPLAYYPVVETMKASAWLNENLKWYELDTPWDVSLARSGPTSWPRAAAGKLTTPSQGIATPGTSVSDIKMSNESITFKVSKIGSPVEVKIPYFPNWHVTGATGPFEVSPNLMAVVPTSHTVTLSYGSSPANHIGDIGTVVGVVGLGALLYFKPAKVGQDPTEPIEPAVPSGWPGPAGIEGVADDSAEGDEQAARDEPGDPVGADDAQSPLHE